MTDETAATPAILVLDSDEETRSLLSGSLRDAGFRVIEASTSDEALGHLRTGGAIALVFAEIHVQGAMDGLGLAQALRQEFPRTQVILTSVHRNEAVPPGVMFMRKPYILARVIAEIRACLQQGAIRDITK
jgi:DNA-binding NtrC family response regulator